MSYQPIPNPLPVSGGFTDAQLRATPLPVSISGGVAITGGLTDTQLRATPLPVSGTFWQATQPVSGTVAVSGSVAVTGTFFQATQPVSIASMPSTPVTGAFFQATQPVSIAGTVAVSGPLTDAQIRATALPVSGTFFQATQPVSIASMPSTPVTGTFWQATQPVSGTVTVGNASLAVTGTFFQGTQPVSAAALPLPAGAATDASLVSILAKQPALGTAGAPSADVLTVQGSQLGSAVTVRFPPSSNASASISEQLGQLFAASMATVHLLSQMLAVLRGQNAPLPGEEADQLIGEFIDQRNKWTNVLT